MSAEEEKQAKVAVLADYIAVKESLELLEEQAEKFSKDFAGLGALLKPEQIWKVGLECYETMLSKEVFEKLSQLKAAIARGKTEASRLRQKVDAIGLGSYLK
ncbi:MAG: hypothetical protein ACHQIK_14535 [Candidatus Acidiferrales bacterium]